MKKNKSSPITTNPKNKIVLYTDKRGNVELRADIERDTLWATQEQIAQLFDVDRTDVTKHNNNIFNNGEVDQKSNVQKMHIAKSDRPVTLYSLDIILAVGYRTNSTRAIQFRQWSTRILRGYLVKGFSVDQRKLSTSVKNFDALKEAIAFLESESRGGPLKAKMVVRLSKNLLP